MEVQQPAAPRTRLQSVWSWVLKNQVWIAFLLCVGIAGGYWLVSPHEYLIQWDAGEYMGYSEFFVKNGQFSFLNFGVALRGYFFPFLLHLFITVGGVLLSGVSDAMLCALASIAFSAFLFAVVLPRIFAVQKTGAGLVARILPFCLFLFWWSDLVFLPLSDLWAFGMSVTAAWLMLLVIEKKDRPLVSACALSFAAGALLYGAYNTRSAYQFVGFAMVVVFAVFKRKQGWKRLLASFACMAVGAVLVALPEMLNHYALNGSLSPKVGLNLYGVQLYWGLEMQRYETMYNALLETGGTRFYDSVGQAIVEREKLTFFNSFAEFLPVAFKYPLEIAGIYVRHFLNMLHLPYRHVYIDATVTYSNALTVFNFVLTYLAGFALLRQKRLAEEDAPKWFRRPAVWLMLCVLIACCTAIPGAVEARFFMPMYVLLYIILVKAAATRAYWREARKYWLPLVVVGVVLFCCLNSVWTACFAAANCGPILP